MVKVKPIFLPSTNAIIGFLDLIMAYVRPFKSLDIAFNRCSRFSISAIRGLLKFVKSFPDEKFPPSPVNTINLISLSF